jgi:hypothetical protein
MMTFGQLEARLREEIPGIAPNEARRRVAASYMRLSMMHEWTHRFREALLAVDASFSHGTITVLNGSPDVVLTPVPVFGVVKEWAAAWSVAPSHRKICIKGVVYDITITGATTGTLVESYRGDNESGIPYTLFRDIYPLPVDCEYGRVKVIWDRTNGIALDQVTLTDLLEGKIDSRIGVGVPEYYALVGMTSETPPRPQVWLGPDAPDTATNLVLFYFTRPTPPAASTEYPDWPERYEEAIWLDAAVEYCASPRTWSPRYLGDLRSRLGYTLSEMRRTMDGQKFLSEKMQTVRLGGNTYGVSRQGINFVPREG